MKKKKEIKKYVHVAITYSNGKYKYYKNGKRVKPPKPFSIEWWSK